MQLRIFSQTENTKKFPLAHSEEETQKFISELRKAVSAYKKITKTDPNVIGLSPMIGLPTVIIGEIDNLNLDILFVDDDAMDPLECYLDFHEFWHAQWTSTLSLPCFSDNMPYHNMSTEAFVTAVFNTKQSYEVRHSVATMIIFHPEDAKNLTDNQLHEISKLKLKVGVHKNIKRNTFRVDS